MDGSLTPLQFPVAAPPPPGRHGDRAGRDWLRMPLPFALDHINLWLLEDGAGWTIVDSGFHGPDQGAVGTDLCRAARGRPVTRVIVTHYHPDHIGLADWLVQRWHMPLWVTEKEWLSARVMSHGARISP